MSRAKTKEALVDYTMGDIAAEQPISELFKRNKEKCQHQKHGYYLKKLHTIAKFDSRTLKVRRVQYTSFDDERQRNSMRRSKMKRKVRVKKRRRRRKFLSEEKKRKLDMIMNNELKLKLIELGHTIVTNPTLKFTIATGEFVSGVTASVFDENRKAKFAKALFSGLSSYRETIESKCEDVIYDNYEPDGWIRSSTITQFSMYLPSILDECEKVVMKIPVSRGSQYNVKQNDSSTFYTFQNGMRLMTRKESVDEGVNTSYLVEWDRLEETEEYILTRIWSLFKNKSIVVTSKKSNDPNRQKESRVVSDDQIYIREDNYIERNPSKNSMEQISMVMKYLEKGKKRSMMYYGPPGTGKSTIANEIIQHVNREMGYRSLRLEVDDIDNSSFDVKRVITIFKPDVIIIDDWDRTSMSDSRMFSIIEMLRRHCKLLVFTCNHIAFDPALIRPGRIDQCVLVEKLDESVVKELLGDEFEHVYEQVKEWPIAFIDELHLRSEVLGTDEAIKSMTDLIDRVELIKKNYRSGIFLPKKDDEKGDY